MIESKTQGDQTPVAPRDSIGPKDRDRILHSRLGFDRYLIQRYYYDIRFYLPQLA